MREWLSKYEHRWNFSLIWEKYSTFFILVFMFIFFSVQSEDFWTVYNIKKIFLQNTYLLIIVLGLAFIMVGGGIDLSLGYQMSLVSVFIQIMLKFKVPTGLIVMCAIMAGICCGLINGILVAYFKVHPFAATLATQIMFRGLSYFISGGRSVSDMPDTYRKITEYHFLRIRVDLWIAMVCIFFAVFMLRFSFYGKYIWAIGLNESVAKRSGINVKRIKCVSYCIGGAFYALAAVILTSRMGIASSAIGYGMEVTGMAVAYIGGVLVRYMRPRIGNLVLSVLLIGVIDNGLPMVGFNTYIKYIIIGVIFIISMVLRKADD